MNATVVFSPMLALMRRVKYSRLFLIVGALLLVPFVYVSKLQLSGAQDDITFNQKETDGVAYLTPVREFLQGVQDLRVYDMARAAGDTSFTTAANKAHDSVERAVAAIDAAEARLGTSMQNQDGQNMSAQPWAGIKAKWAEIQGQTFSTPEDSSREYTALVAATTDFITNVLANYSNLILDPDLDSYWLMDGYCVRVPALSETIGGSASILISAARRGELSEEARLELAALVAKAEVLSVELATNMNVAYANNKSGKVRPAVEPLTKTALGDVKSYCDDVRANVLLTKTIGTNVSAVAKRATDVNASVHALFAGIGPQLDKLTRARVNTTQASWTTGVVVGIGAVLLLIYVLASFYLEITSMLNESRRQRERAEKENEALQGNIMGLLTVVAEAAEGDLTLRATVTEGSLGNVADAMNQMLDNWAAVLTEALVATQETAAATGKITEVSRRVTEGASRQVEMLRAVDKTVQDITSRILKVSQNANTAAQAAARTQESASTGAESVNNVVQGMEGLRANVQAGAKKIKNLGDRSMEISGIVATIAKISEQTNMLALNAAIEAARAGEQGRGFSVVADEVRKLAERTASATEEISKLVSGIQAETSESVQAIEEQTHAVEEEAIVVQKAGDALHKIQGESTQSAELISDISSTAKSQVDVATQAVKSVEQVSRIAEEAAKSSSENLALTQTLDAMSRKLNQSMSKFKLVRT